MQDHGVRSALKGRSDFVVMSLGKSIVTASTISHSEAYRSQAASWRSSELDAQDKVSYLQDVSFTVIWTFILYLLHQENRALVTPYPFRSYMHSQLALF